VSAVTRTLGVIESRVAVLKRTRRNSRVDNRVADSVTEHAELSPTEWVREQSEAILKNGTTDGGEVLDARCDALAAEPRDERRRSRF